METFLADVEAAAERLPAVARRALRRAGCRFVVHEETGDLRETAYGRFQPDSTTTPLTTLDYYG